MSAAAGRLCVRAEAAEGPLPGYAFLSGPAGLARFSRLVGGARCWDALPAGRYAVEVFPFESDAPLAAAKAADVAARGDALVEFRAPVPVGGREARVAVSWPIRPAAAPTEVLFMAEVRSSSGTRHSFHRAFVPPAGGEFRFSLPEGALSALEARAEGWVALPGVWHQEGSLLVVRVHLKPAAKVRGRIEMSDGALSTPRPLTGYARSIMRVAVMELSRSRGITAVADDEGRFELLAPVGPGYFDSWQEGDGGKISSDPLALVRVPTEGLDLVVRARRRAAGLSVAGRREGQDRRPGAHMLFGAPAGVMARLNLDACSQEALPVFLIRDDGGRWRPRDSSVRGGGEHSYEVWVDSGAYDFVSAEMRDLPYPSLRVLGARDGVALVPGRNELTLPEDRPRGACHLSADMPVAPLRLEDLDRAKNVGDFCLALFPQLQVFDSEGRLVASAGAGLAKEDLDAVFAAYARRDQEALGLAIGSATRGLRLSGLPEGKYRYRLLEWGRPPREGETVLRETAPTRLTFEPLP